MFQLQVDLGQVIIVGCMGIIGWLVKNKIGSFEKRLDKHDDLILKLTAELNRLSGRSE